MAETPAARASSGACTTSSTAASRRCAPPIRRCCTGASTTARRSSSPSRVFVVASLGLAPFIGRDFFPTVDSGQMRLHARAPAGTRIEETEVIFANIENEIRQVIPAREIDTIIDNIGIPNGGFNLAFGDSPTIGTGDGDILISLNPEEHGPTAAYTDQLRKRLHQRFPDVTFFFEAANITNQILNFGLPAPIDVQVVGRNAAANYQIAQQIRTKIARIPGAADVHIHQVVD